MRKLFFFRNSCAYKWNPPLIFLVSLFLSYNAYASEDLSDEQANKMIKNMGIEDEGLGAKDPDLYDILDYLQDRTYENKIKNLEAKGLEHDEAVAKLDKEKQEAILQEAKKTHYITGFPFIGYNAYTGTAYGVIGNYSAYFGLRETTNLSAFNAVAVYTSNKQLTFRVMNQYYSENNNNFITGYVMWASTPGATYGVGGNTPESNEVTAKKTFFKLNEGILF